MDILILGNGFDIAHGLNTKYSDFLDYIDNNRLKNVVGITNKYKDFFENNVWLKYFLVEKNNIGENWIDLEKKIYNAIEMISNNHDTNTTSYYPAEIKFQKNSSDNFSLYRMIKTFSKTNASVNFNNQEYCIHNYDFDMVYVYLKSQKGLIDFLYKQLRDFTKLFEQYLDEIILKSLDKSNKKYKLCISNKCISLLNFNYTNTCEQLYGINFNYNDCGIKTKAVYIHGKVQSGNNCNLVLGTKSFDNEVIPAEFNIFKKHHQRHRYGTIEPYQELLNELKYSKKVFTPIFHIIGHSLDESDHNILRHILLARDKSIINVYYHDEEALARMQSNIDVIIGEEEAMSKVRFIKQDDPEKGILIPLPIKETIYSI